MKKARLAENATVKAVQVDGICSSMKLSEIVQALEPEFKSIISAFRVRDYEKGEDTDRVFIILMDNGEYERVVNDAHSYGLKRNLTVSCPPVTFVSAYFKQSLLHVDPREISKVPIPVAITLLPRMSCNTTAYVATLLKTFESFVNIKGFRWCIEFDRILTRSFGFIAVTSIEEALKCANITFACADGAVEAKLCDAATILLHKSRDYLVSEYRKAILTELIMNANLLNGV